MFINPETWMFRPSWMDSLTYLTTIWGDVFLLGGRKGPVFLLPKLFYQLTGWNEWIGKPAKHQKLGHVFRLLGDFCYNMTKKEKRRKEQKRHHDLYKHVCVSVLPFKAKHPQEAVKHLNTSYPTFSQVCGFNPFEKILVKLDHFPK